MEKEMKYPGYTHIALEITDAISVSKQLEALGLKITERVEYNGAQFFFIRDPDDNVIEFHQPGRSLEVTPEALFTTSSLLIGNFKSAATTLSKGVSEVGGHGVLKKSFRTVVHPVDMSEGGLCEVEDRILTELLLGAGAHRVAIHQGSQLTREAALQLIA